MFNSKLWVVLGSVSLCLPVALDARSTLSRHDILWARCHSELCSGSSVVFSNVYDLRQVEMDWEVLLAYLVLVRLIVIVDRQGCDCVWAGRDPLRLSQK